VIDETHDAGLRSWVDAANAPDCDFPLQNLPFAIFRRLASNEPWRGGVAIGDQVLDLAATRDAAPFDGDAAAALASACGPTLNALMALGPRHWSALRLALSRQLRDGAPQAAALRRCLVPLAEVEYAVPARIGDYTDFYASIHHATNVGRLFRPDNPLMPNYKWVPIGYHGRVSSIGVSGRRFPRPRGQVLPPGASTPVYAPSGRLDYELEVGIWMGPGNTAGRPIPVGEAGQHVFGLCLLNDWSARDIQAWEYQPLGPFLSKNFATTISPWIVTMQALEPYRLPWTRAAGDPQPLPYLEPAHERACRAIDLQLEAWLESAAMRAAGTGPCRLSRTSFRHAYWSVEQLVAHHASGGCNLEPGDLYGSGTQSGPGPAEGGALIELSAGGRQAVPLANGEARTFLEDGDTVILRGWCEKPGFARLGFGECRGTVLPATGG
jgi:fumarylacetoacetase